MVNKVKCLVQVRRVAITCMYLFYVYYTGYDKLTHYGFPIHGCVDGASRKVMWLRALRSNKLPQVVSSLLLNCIEEQKKVFCRLRSDKGTENIYAATIMMAIGGPKAHIFGTSTRNTRIESFWGRLRKNLGIQQWITFFETITSKEGGDDKIYDEKDPYHIIIAHFVFGDLINASLEAAMTTWNTHRIRKNKKTDFAGGAPNAMYLLPAKWGWKDYSVPVPLNLRASCEAKGFTFDLDDPFGLNSVKALLNAALLRAGFDEINMDNKAFCFMRLVHDVELKAQVMQMAVDQLSEQESAMEAANSKAKEYYESWEMENSLAYWEELQQELESTPAEVDNTVEIDLLLAAMEDMFEAEEQELGLA
jgi:hypothetical protein